MSERRSVISNVFLYPLSLVYGIIMYLRNKLFDYKILRSSEFGIPVISIGNINVGGTGKTPHIEYLISILKKEFIVAALSRGYKRKTRNFVLASKTSTVYDIGDEPRQIKNKFPDTIFAVDENRSRGIKTLVAHNKSIDVVLLDDAFQHRSVIPGISILLIDYHYPLYEDHLLPLGRLRESQTERRRANIIIISKSPHEMKPIEKRLLIKHLNPFPYQNLYFTTLEYEKPKPVFLTENEFSESLFENKNDCSILLITGIANPLPLIHYLKSFCKDIQHIQYSDHHSFTKNDFINILKRYESIKKENKVIFTTEKDAVRIMDSKFASEIKHLPMYYIPVNIRFLNNDNEVFNNQIIDYVRKNKKYSQLYSRKS